MKIGTRVRTTRKNGEKVTGKFGGEWQRANGTWARVDVPTEKRGQYTSLYVRPTQVERA